MTEKFRRKEVKEEEPQGDWWGDFLKMIRQKYKPKETEDDHKSEDR